MALVEITEVRLARFDQTRLRGRVIEAPVGGSESDAASIRVSGWAIGGRSAVVAVEVVYDGTVLRRAAIDVPRPDVAAAFPHVGGAETSGFQTSFAVTRVAPEFELVLTAVFRDGGRARLATVVGRHRAWLSGAPPPVEAVGAPATDEDLPPGPPRRPRCSVILPVFNRASLTRQCLNTLLAQEHHRAEVEIVVVDDASTDLTERLLADYADQVQVVGHETNLGFATSCNDGATTASGEYLIFLNNDTLPQPGWLDALVAYAEEHPEAAVVGSKLLFPDDTVQHCGVVIGLDRMPRHIYAGFPADHPAVNRSRPFQIVTAACALFRRDVFEEAGGFDTAFVNGWEDVDLCLRLGEAGQEVHYCHTSVLHHLESVSRNVRAPHERQNNQLYVERWGDRVEPDDLLYYLADDLLSIRYSYAYPLHLTASPLLAVLGGEERDHQIDKLLTSRSAQVLNLLKHTVFLNVRLQEAELRAEMAPADGAPSAGAAAAPVAEPAEPRLLAEGSVRAPAGEGTGRLVSVVMVVKNGAAALAEGLPRLLAQRTGHGLEIVAVDRGSTDDTVEVLREFGATVVAIDPRSFNPGSTRNLAAGYATGDLLVFLDQDALPADDGWLEALVAPLTEDAELAAVCSRVLPRDDVDALTYGERSRDPHAAPQRRVQAITDRAAFEALNPEELRRFLAFHLLGTAIRADLFAGLPFREVAFSGVELLWANEALEAGFKIQHEPTTIVRYSPEVGVVDRLRHGFDEGVLERAVAGAPLAEHQVVPRILDLIRDDWRYLEQTTWSEPADLDEWRLQATMRRTAEVFGQWLGANLDAVPEEVTALLSALERSRVGQPPPMLEAVATS